MRYVILTSKSLEELAKHVNEKLGLGFAPSGGVAVCTEQEFCRDTSTTYDSSVFIQAMVST